MSKIYIFGGGTIQHVRPHLCIGAPAYGSVAKELHKLAKARGLDSELVLTKMADSSSNMETNEDVYSRVTEILSDPSPSTIIFSVAMCDFVGSIAGKHSKHLPRLDSSDWYELHLETAPKVISNIRKTRKDIFLVGFKTTTGDDEDKQFERGLRLIKQTSANLVLANDIHNKRNMIITPEGARYNVTTDRDSVISTLLDMTIERSELTFTPTNVVEGNLVDWDNVVDHPTLTSVINHCVDKGAYKAFNGKTPGHYGVLLDDNSMLSSVRKRNYNNIEERAMVKVHFNNDGTVDAYGAKPSVGTRSQYEVLSRAPSGYNCIIHFHCPMKSTSMIAVQSQKEFECGSLECGMNTHNGIQYFDGIGAVMLDKHGPNIIFKSDMSASVINKFIDDNFDLTKAIR